jgi:hypothetical protein
MAESRDWAAVCIAPVIRRETSSPFQVVPVHKESPGRITASFEYSQAALFPDTLKYFVEKMRSFL